jgi:hypothetical protein
LACKYSKLEVAATGKDVLIAFTTWKGKCRAFSVYDVKIINGRMCRSKIQYMVTFQDETFLDFSIEDYDASVTISHDAAVQASVQAKTTATATRTVGIDIL